MRRAGGIRELVLLALAVLFLFLGYGPPALLVPSFDPGPRPGGVLRIVTWNVGQSGGQGLRSEDVSHVAEVLSTLDPDLCFLQEVADEDRAAALTSTLGEGWTSVASPPGARGLVLALARRGTLSRVPAESVDVRGVAVRYAPFVGRSVVAVGLHADEQSASVRQEEIGLALRELFARGEGSALVLVGSLGFDLDLDKQRGVLSASQQADAETYDFLVDRLVDATHGRGATAEPDRRLDYVFADPRSFRPGRAGAVPGRRAPGMDHRPVVADLVPK